MIKRETAAWAGSRPLSLLRVITISEQQSQQQPHDKERQTVSDGVCNPIKRSHMRERLPKICDPCYTTEKRILESLEQTVSLHLISYEQEQSGDYGIGEHSVDGKCQRHGTVLRKNTGAQNRLIPGRNGKLSDDAHNRGDCPYKKNVP